MALCETCLGLDYELSQFRDPPPGGPSVAEFWEESKIFSGSPPPIDMVVGGRTIPEESLRDQYEMAKKKYDPEPRGLADISDRMAVAKAQAEWNALVQAYGDEEKALKAMKFYEVEATPREVVIEEKDKGARMQLEFDIVIRPKPRPYIQPKEGATLTLCAACEVGDHKWHDYAVETTSQPCVCGLCKIGKGNK